MSRMWRIVVILCLAVIAAAALLIVRNANQPAPTGGGKTDNTDPNAPKMILSTEILSFECEFSTSAHIETGSLDRGYYTLKASLENGVVTGSYYCAANTKSANFEADAAFMEELHNVVAKQDLTKYNGRSIRVGGLPPHLGCQLYITYASGEKISASNNQSNFLTQEAMEALEAVFRQAAFETDSSEGGLQ